MHKRFIILIFGLLFILASQGQNQKVREQAIQSDTLKAKNFNTFLVPIVFYSPETNFAIGGGGQLLFKTKNSSTDYLNSSILASAIYTLRKQLILEIQPQIYFNKENYFLDSRFRYKIFPNIFWGVGPQTADTAQEDYNQTEIFVEATFLKHLSNDVNFGFNFTYANYDITEVEEGGILASDSIIGSNGANIVGLGFVFNLDQRDNKQSPLKGGFYQFKTNFASRVMGSTQSFNNYQLDLRKYINILNNHILAVQFLTKFNFGEVPFQALSHYGGGDVARGFYKGRYMDRHLYVVQMEYRLPIFKRWELAAFALTGNVGNDKKGEMLFDDFKSSFGFGPRYFIYKDKRICLRLDIGINNDGGAGIYFGVNEAF